MKTTLVVAALAAACLAAPAVAQDRAVTRTVAHADLNLASAHDVARLDHRIRHAAQALCGTPSAFDLTGRRKHGACVADAVARTAAARAAAIGSTGATMVAAR